MAIRNTLLSHSHKATGSSQLLQAFVSFNNISTVLLMRAFLLSRSLTHSAQQQSHSLISKSYKIQHNFYNH